MAHGNFRKAHKLVLREEGGYSDHPKDPGGRTLQGITQRTNDAYRKNIGKLPRPLSPRLASDPEWIQERDEIYLRQYWNAIHGDMLPSGIDLIVYDAAVNSGPAQATKFLQATLGVDVDGHMGQQTIAATRRFGPQNVITNYKERRLAFLQALNTWSTFGQGWTDRVSRIHAVASSWARATDVDEAEPVVVPEPLPDAGSKQKADPKDVSKAPVGPGKTGTIAIIIESLRQALEQGREYIEPYAGSFKWLGYVLGGIAVTLALLALFGIYRNWRAAKALAGQATTEGV